MLAAALAGCAWLGPEIIRSGRPAYNDAILTTNDEQLLQNIVRLRFGDSVGFLTVSSVTANVSFTTTGTVNVGLGGPPANYQGNLVPFAGTVSSEQNPTISYAPMSGDRLLRQFAGEVPLDLAILLINTAHSHGAAWMAIVRRVNNLRNPDYLDPPVLVVDPKFEEIAALAGELQRRGVLYWVRLAGAQTGYAVVLHSYSPANSREVARLLDLLGIPRPVSEGDDVVIPVRLSVGSPDPGAIAIETRPLLDLMRLAAAAIELPADAGGRRALSRTWSGRQRDTHPRCGRTAGAGAGGGGVPRPLVLHRQRRWLEQAVVHDAAAARRRTDPGHRRDGPGADRSGYRTAVGAAPSAGAPCQQPGARRAPGR